ncbi:extracellular solute-binding protein [Sinomicrobium pectinilyticum]|uniref:Extracellular solute-binding protein n=1 Tax=Sinomicrobium pectinilyticum TaxID=1084421 RepID=A0A3N0DYH9_SINP1|nr:extracellular solute-binding protein [Sinomicrobium pectinilyticum]RNL80611.1 extracellular solute-binding protein [Sinomicrobium pectinilyticum]
MAKKVLKGMTWGHSRGIVPLQAFAQRFNQLYPDIEVQWRQRTLQEFADYPIEKLTETYDLLIIDHPWVGCAAATNCVLPLDEHLSREYLDNQAENQVGGSHDSYRYGGHQWALAIDAAAPVPSFRKDLLDENGQQVPASWTEVMELARMGKVAAPAIPIDLLMNFYMFCQVHGQEPFQQKEQVIDRKTGLKALQTMKEFYSLLDRRMFDANPIRVAEMMSMTNDFWYCPFAYGYSNYSRDGYSKYLLTYGNLVSFDGTKKLRSTIGGTGLAVSAFSAFKEEALLFVEMIVSETNQSTEYALNGGQPGHRKAWIDERTNYITRNYFRNTLESLDESYMRPRYHGYLHFQDHAGDPIRDYMMGEGSPQQVLETIDSIYQESQMVAQNER